MIARPDPFILDPFIFCRNFHKSVVAHAFLYQKERWNRKREKGLRPEWHLLKLFWMAIFLHLIPSFTAWYHQ